MIVQLMAVLLAALGFAPPAQVHAQVQAPATSRTASGVPTEQVWLSDVHAVIADAPAYVKARSADAAPDSRLALNLDIDNTSIASYFGGGPIVEVRALTRMAHRHGVAVLFNTARIDSHRSRTLSQLRAAGYRVDGLCMRAGGETKVASKQRCRAEYADQGYTLIANLGNNTTDFAGSGYDRAYRLPNYGGLLP